MQGSESESAFAAWYAATPVTLFVSLALIVLTAGGFLIGRERAIARVEGRRAALHSLPDHHGFFVAIATALPAFAVVVAYAVFGDAIAEMLLRPSLPPEVTALPPERQGIFIDDARALAFGGAPSQEGAALAAAADALRRIDAALKTGAAALAAILGLAGLIVARARITSTFRARNAVERVIRTALFSCAALAILTTVGIVASLVFETARFLDMTRPQGPAVFGYLAAARDFLFGLHWSPQTAIRADQIGQSGAFGAIPLFYGTMMITAIAMLVAAPIGLFSAIYLSEYATSAARAVVKPLLEILAGIPTVVYGFFALLTVAPVIRAIAASLGVDAPAQSALAAGVVMGVMIIPFVSSLSDDVINAVPQGLRDASFAMGATKSETITRVVLPAALPGVIGALLLAVSRAVGETMIVVMAAGQAARITVNPLESVTTITVQIVALLTGDTEFDSAKTLSAFALGLVLFLITLLMNVIALQIVRRFRERYE